MKSSLAMKEVCALAARVATSDANVLIAGESGAGKGLLARYIHERSQRAGRPFIAANCAVFHDELLGSELFGYPTGSVTADRSTRARGRRTSPHMRRSTADQPLSTTRNETGKHAADGTPAALMYGS